MLLVSCILNIHTHVGLSKLANKLAQQSQFVSCVKDVVLTSRFIAKLKHAVYFHRCIQCPLFFRVVGWIVFQRILRQQMRVYLHMCAICKAYLRAKYQSAKLDLTINLPKKKLSLENTKWFSNNISRTIKDIFQPIYLEQHQLLCMLLRTVKRGCIYLQLSYQSFQNDGCWRCQKILSLSSTSEFS